MTQKTLFDSGKKKPVVTWLTPYFEVWVEFMGGKPSGQRFGKALKELDKQHGAVEVAARFRNYLTELRDSGWLKTASVEGFASKFGIYGNALARPNVSDNEAELQRYLADRAKR